MPQPDQILDKNQRASGFYKFAETPVQLADEAHQFSATEGTAIVCVTGSGFTFQIGDSPTGTGLNHYAPAGAYPLWIPAGDSIYVHGTVNISVLD